MNEVAGWQITLIGMGAVFVFLYLLMFVIQFYSWIVRETQDDDVPMNKVAAAIAIALHQQGRKK